jgi:hypothetical protein
MLTAYRVSLHQLLQQQRRLIGMNKISFDVRGDVCYYNVHDNNVNKLFLFNGLSNRFGSPYRILLDAASAQPRNKADYFQLGSKNASYHITTTNNAH